VQYYGINFYNTAFFDIIKGYFDEKAEKISTGI